MRNGHGLPCVEAINQITFDTEAELGPLKKKMAHHQVNVVMASYWAYGGKGAEAVAHEVVPLIDDVPSDFKFVHEDELPFWDKVNAVAKNIYSASEVTADSKVRTQIKRLQADGYGHYPICIAKTQYSFSTDPALQGAPTGHSLNVREVRLSVGTEFIVMICGDIMTMPGLPKVPSADKINITEDARVAGLF